MPRKYSSDQSSCSSLKPELCYLTERVNEGTCGHLSWGAEKAAEGKAVWCRGQSCPLPLRGRGLPGTPVDLKGPHGFIPGLLSQSMRWEGALGGLHPTHQPPCRVRPHGVARRIAGTLCSPAGSCRDGCVEVTAHLPSPRAPKAEALSEALSPISRVPCLERPAPSGLAFPQGTTGPQRAPEGCSRDPHRASLATHRGTSRHASKEPTVSYFHLGPNSGAQVISGHQETVVRGPIPIPLPRLLHWAPSENKDSWV